MQKLQVEGERQQCRRRRCMPCVDAQIDTPLAGCAPPSEPSAPTSWNTSRASASRSCGPLPDQPYCRRAEGGGGAAAVRWRQSVGRQQRQAVGVWWFRSSSSAWITTTQRQLAAGRRRACELTAVKNVQARS